MPSAGDRSRRELVARAAADAGGAGDDQSFHVFILSCLVSSSMGITLLLGLGFELRSRMALEKKLIIAFHNGYVNSF